VDWPPHAVPGDADPIPKIYHIKGGDAVGFLLPRPVYRQELLLVVISEEGRVVLQRQPVLLTSLLARPVGRNGVSEARKAIEEFLVVIGVIPQAVGV